MHKMMAIPDDLGPTINDLRTNISLSEKSMKMNFSKWDKDEETGSSRKIYGKKGKAPMDDLDGKALKSDGIIRGSFGIRLVDKKWGLIDGSNSEHDPEANFRHRGCTRHETVIPINIGVSLRDGFFYDIKSCSTKPAILMR